MLYHGPLNRYSPFSIIIPHYLTVTKGAKEVCKQLLAPSRSYTKQFLHTSPLLNNNSVRYAHNQPTNTNSTGRRCVPCKNENCSVGPHCSIGWSTTPEGKEKLYVPTTVSAITTIVLSLLFYCIAIATLIIVITIVVVSSLITTHYFFYNLQFINRYPKPSVENVSEMIGLANRVMVGTYAKPPIIFTSGSGMYMYDTEGKKYDVIRPFNIYSNHTVVDTWISLPELR